MKNIKLYILSALLVSSIVACKKDYFEVETELDPNAPPVAFYIKNASRAQISQLGVGLQSVLRNGFTDFGRVSGTVGREIIFSASTDNRYYTELLGTNTAQYTGTAAGANDPAGIFNTYYSSYSQTRRRAENFIFSAQNTTSITPEEQKAVEGFARTLQAFVTLNLTNMQGKNGIRESFTDLITPGDLLKPGKFGTYETALALCKKYADDGLAALNAAGGAAFPFKVNSGFTGFTSAAQFKKFNRAVAARIAMYQNDWDGVLAALNESYLDLTGNLKNGPVFIFSTVANDITNGLFHTPNSTTAPFVVFNEVIAAAEPNDKRIFPVIVDQKIINADTLKVAQRNAVRQSGKFNSTHEVVMYKSNVSSASIIRNEELVLMYAEAKAQNAAFADAKTALDLIRTTYGLPAYAGALNLPALIDEVLKQRRFSLFFEGHRWFDMRRYNKLAEITPQGNIDGSNFVVFEAMSRPDAEVQWDLANP